MHISCHSVLRHRSLRSVALATATATLLAACGSSSGSSSSSNSGTSTSGGSSASQSSSGQSGGSSQSYASLLKAARTATPSSYEGPTTPSKAPGHVNLAVVTCSSQLSGCVSPATGLQQAAKTLGWTVHVYDGGGTSQKQVAAMLDAISNGARVIATIAINPNLVQQGLRAAKKAHVLVVSGSDGIDTPNPVEKPTGGNLGYAFDVGPNYAALGKKAGQWIIGNSDGKANIAVFSDKEFPSVLALQSGLLKELKTCSTCTVSPLQYFNGTQVGTTLGSQVTGYVQAHPGVDYVFAPYDPAAAAMVTAIAQAGLVNKVKVVGVLGSQQNINFIRKGQVQAADAAYDNQYMGYMIVDQTIRELDHKPLFNPHGGNLPFVMLDKTNLPSNGANWTASFGYTSKFESLWK